MDKSYVVYKHTSPSNKCYIGITKQKPPEKRWGTGGMYYLKINKKGNYIHPKFAYAILKYGWEKINHEILYINLTEEEAKQREIELVLYYKQLQLSYNVTDGGDTHHGCTFTTEERQRRAETARKIMLGRHHTEETKQKLSASKKGKPSTISKEKWAELSAKLSQIKTGKPHPHKGNISENTKKACIEAKKKAVLQYTKNGIFIKEFSSIIEAALEVGAFAGNITAACKGKVKSCKGFVWKYKQNG